MAISTKIISTIVVILGPIRKLINEKNFTDVLYDNLTFYLTYFSREYNINRTAAERKMPFGQSLCVLRDATAFQRIATSLSRVPTKSIDILNFRTFISVVYCMTPTYVCNWDGNNAVPAIFRDGNER